MARADLQAIAAFCGDMVGIVDRPGGQPENFLLQLLEHPDAILDRMGLARGFLGPLLHIRVCARDRQGNIRAQ